MSEPVTVPAPPVLVTVPQVELIHAGRWNASTGVWDVTPTDLGNAVAACDCPAVHRPILKLGHTDARFDGEPAVGYVTNMAVSARGSELVGDFAGMPAWLAKKDDAGQSVLASSYPQRSIEGEYDYRCALGHTHPFVLTGVALLGSTPPAVGTLESLADVAALFGVSASTAVAAARALEESMPNRAKVAATATVEDVRRAFYDGPAASNWWWIEEMYVDPTEMIVVDDDSGDLYRVAYTVAADGSITFGDPQTVKRTYVAASTAMRTPSGAWASKAESRPGGATGSHEPVKPSAAAAVGNTSTKDGGPAMAELTEAQASLRDTLGLPADATADDVIAAAQAALTKKPEPAEQPTPAEQPGTQQVTQVAVPPEGMSLVDSGTLEELRVAAAAGVAAKARQDADDRRRTVAAAVSDGRIPPARVTHWEQALATDPVGMGQALANMTKGLIPVAAMGHSATGVLDGQVSAAAQAADDTAWVVAPKRYTTSATGSLNNGVEA